MPDDQRTNEIEKRIDREITGSIAISSRGQGSLVVAPQNMTEVMELAKLMSVSGICIRPIFRGNPGSCLAIVLQAMKWGADPFAVANKAFEVNGQLSYESQLVHAIVNASPVLDRRLQATFSGEGQTRRCLVVGHIKGEDEPREYESPKLNEITPKNSPLWKTDPDQQLWYYSSRAWARRWVPEILLGIYTPDELETIDVTPTPSPPPRPQRQDFVEHQPEPDDKPFCFTTEDGDVLEFRSHAVAADEYGVVLDAAARTRGEAGINAVWENGAQLMSALRDSGHEDVADQLSQEYRQLLARARDDAAQVARARSEPERQTIPGCPHGTDESDGWCAQCAADLPGPEMAAALMGAAVQGAGDRDTATQGRSPAARPNSPAAQRPAAAGERDPSKAVYTDPEWPHPPAPAAVGEPLAVYVIGGSTVPPELESLVDRGDAVAGRGTEALQSWWQHGLSALQRGSLGARGRGVGPYLEAWKVRAAEVDAAKKLEQDTEARSEPATPAPEPIAVPLPPAPPAAPIAPVGDLLGEPEQVDVGPQSIVPSTVRRLSSTTDHPNLAIDPPLKNGNPDWRTWVIALFLPMLRKFNDDVADLAFYLADNDDNIAHAKTAGFKDEIEAAISAQFRVVDGNGKGGEG